MFTQRSQVFYKEVVYPVLFKICPLTMRTKPILMVGDMTVILARRPGDGKHSPPLRPC